MATAADLAKQYFESLAAHDLETALDYWAPGAVDRFVGAEELVAPDGIRAYFTQLFAAFPDFRFEILELTSSDSRCAVRWRARGTFAGPGSFQGFTASGARLDIEGCDVVSVGDGKIQHNDAYVDSGEIARQLGVLPPAGSPAQARLTRLANARTKVRAWVHGLQPERIADGVWVVRGGFPARTMNVYMVEDAGGGVVVFDAGISDMTALIGAAGARLGGIRRVVLGHADADHRGAAPGLAASVYCHPAEKDAAQSSTAFRDYWDLSKLAPHGRLLFRRLLPAWDGGAVEIAGTVQEGDEVAGFRVIDLPGHAPGLIGLFRASDRLALISDCFYTLDVQTGVKGGPRVPHPAFNADSEQARASLRKLAEIDPAIAWGGHANPVRGDVAGQLRLAASTTP